MVAVARPGADNKSFDMTIVSHTEPMDYDIYGRDYYFGYRSKAFDALMAQLNATVDPAARHGVLVKIQEQIADDAVNGFCSNIPSSTSGRPPARDVGGCAGPGHRGRRRLTTTTRRPAAARRAAQAGKSGGSGLGFAVLAGSILLAAYALLRLGVGLCGRPLRLAGPDAAGCDRRRVPADTGRTGRPRRPT